MSQPIDLSSAFSFADLIGSDLIAQYLGDDAESMAESLLVINPKTVANGYSASLAVQFDSGTAQVPLIGSSIALDFSGATASTDATSDPNTFIVADLQLTTAPFSFTVALHNGVKLWFSPDVLVPQDGSDAVEIALGSGMSITFSSSGIKAPDISLQLPACGLGQTGINLTGGTLTLALWGNGGSTALEAAGVDASFRGVVLTQVGFTLPPELTGMDVSKLVIQIATIGNGGFSGSFELDFSGDTFNLLGATFQPGQLKLDIEQNSVASASLEGVLTLPFFDSGVQTTLGFSAQGWSLSLSGDIVDIQAQAFELSLTNIGIEENDSQVWIKISGSLTPQVAGFNFPKLDLKDILVNKVNGKAIIKAAGGAMTLSCQQQFQLGDILTAKLTKFGFGGDGAGGCFITMSGGISLIEALPLEAQFDTLKVSWSPSVNGGTPQLTLKGATIDIEIPDLFEFGGSLTYINTVDSSGNKLRGFSGSIDLSIIPAQLEIDGHFKVLEVTAPPASPPPITYTALGIEMNLTLPAAIPLMQTNLGIYGFNGLVAWNYGPNLPAYNNDWFQWFMGRPTGWTVGQTQEVGVVDSSPTSTIFIDKWGPDSTKKGAGAGFTIGTMVDTGFSWHARATFIVLVPGPDLILAGECNFVSLQPGMDSAVTGAFQLMIAYDGDAETLNAAISAQVGKDPIFYASGAANAFFDFNNPSAWYLDIGTKAIPIQATVAKMLNGTAYLDLSSNELDAGAQAGYSGNFQAGPLKASVSAHVGFDAVLTRRPLRLTGDATLQGTLNVSAWKVTANVGLSADITMDAMVLAGPVPPPNIAYKFHFQIQADLHAKVLFVNLSASETITVDISSPNSPDAPDAPVYPLKAVSMEIPAHSAESWPLPLTHVQTASNVLSEDVIAEPAAPAQGVPPDSLPTLVFGVPVYDQSSIGTNPPLDGSVQVGNTSYTYTLVSIVIQDSNQAIVYSSLAADQAAPTNAVAIWGQWCEELGARGKTRLQLFSDNPYFLSLRTTPANGLADSSASRGPSPCAGISETVTGTCVSVCDFQWTAVDSGPDEFLMDGSSSSGFVFYVRGPRPCGRLIQNVSSVSMEAPVCWVIVAPGDELKFPSLAALVEFTALSLGRLTPLRIPLASAVRVLDAAGQRLHVTIKRTASGSDADFEISIPTGNAVKIVFEHELALSSVCIYNEQQAQQIESAAALNTQLTTALQNGASGNLKPSPFNPGETYSMAVTVSVQGAGGSGSFIDTVQFTTGGPPGLLIPANPTVTDPNGYPVGGQLVDLGRYVAANTPQADADRIYPFDNPYRGYDPSVVFNEGYVIELYSAASTELGQNADLILDVVDANGNSVTAQANGPIASGTISRPSIMGRFRGLWAGRLSNQCGITQLYPPNEGLSLPLNQRTALSPRCQYNLQVSAGQTNAPIVYQAGFSSSRFLTVTHHVQSHPDAAFALALDSAAVFTSLAQVCTLPAYSASLISETEADLFDQIYSDLALPPCAPRETLDGSALYAPDGTCRAILFTTPEPLPWDRININSAGFAATRTAIIRPVTIAITDISIDNTLHGYVELVLLEDGDPSGITVSQMFEATHSPRRAAITQQVYSFENEGIWPSGTVFRLVNGRAPNNTSPDIVERQLDNAAFPLKVLGFTTNSSSQLLHQRSYLASYANWTYQIVRKRDGSAFFLVATDSGGNPVNLAQGELKFSLSIVRDMTNYGDPGGFRLWMRCGIASSPEAVAWHVRIPPAN